MPPPLKPLFPSMHSATAAAANVSPPPASPPFTPGPCPPCPPAPHQRPPRRQHHPGHARARHGAKPSPPQQATRAPPPPPPKPRSSSACLSPSEPVAASFTCLLPLLHAAKSNALAPHAAQHARQAPIPFKLLMASELPWAAARRNHRMASALSCAIPRPSRNMTPKLF